MNSLKLVNVDIIDDGELLATIEDSTQDFVIVNHFIEHCQNPIGALGSIFRVLRSGGVLYLAIPDKRYTFDIDRQVTSIDHIMKDFTQGPQWSKMQHFNEWTRLVDKVKNDVEVEEHVRHLLDIDYSIHYHVWTQLELLEILTMLVRKMGLTFDLEQFLKIGEEAIFVLRKT